METVAVVVLFVVTYLVDRAAYDGAIQLPSWVLSGTSDSARVAADAVAAAIITVVGIVFSITIVALTLASTQFGRECCATSSGTREQVALGTSWRRSATR